SFGRGFDWHRPLQLFAASTSLPVVVFSLRVCYSPGIGATRRLCAQVFIERLEWRARGEIFILLRSEDGLSNGKLGWRLIGVAALICAGVGWNGHAGRLAAAAPGGTRGAAQNGGQRRGTVPGGDLPG